MKKVTVTFDKEANAAYVSIRSDRIKRTAELDDDVLADMNEDDKVVGVEILNVVSVETK